MKKLIAILTILLTLSACTSEVTSDEGSTSPIDEGIENANTSIQNMEWSGCYSYIEEGDETHSYYLRLDCKDSTAFGSMIQKVEAPNIEESINGDLKGTILDSIIAVDYTYTTEEGTFTTKEEFKMNSDHTLSRKASNHREGTSVQIFKISNCADFPILEDGKQNQ